MGLGREIPRSLNVPSRLKIYARYVQYLLWEFRLPLVVFWSLVLFGGLLLRYTYHHEVPGELPRYLGYGEACYAVFMLIFLESYLEFPDQWYLQPAFFLLPIIGLGAVADSLVRLAFLIFSQKQRLPEWQHMVASLYRNHVVVVGVGKVGYQIIRGILELHEAVVVVERPGPDSTLIEEVIDLGVPIIRGDGRTEKVLEQAGVQVAQAVVLATSDDLTNLDAALTARDLNPDARIVLRLFDESLAVKVRGAFAMPAISTPRVSAPAFIAAATGRQVYQELELAGERVYLIDLTIKPNGSLVGRTVGQVQSERGVNIVMHHGRGGVDVNPTHDIVLDAGDSVLLIAPMPRLLEVQALNRSGGDSARAGNLAPGGPPPRSEPLDEGQIIGPA